MPGPVNAQDLDKMVFPCPGEPRRYSISQLLYMEKVLPYVICPRDAFHFNAFQYKVIHIPGLANESTGIAAIDHEALKAAFHKEFAARDVLKSKGYSYLTPNPDWKLYAYVKALWVELTIASRKGAGNWRTVYRPTPYAQLVAQGLVKNEGYLNPDFKETVHTPPPMTKNTRNDHRQIQNNKHADQAGQFSEQQTQSGNQRPALLVQSNSLPFNPRDPAQLKAFAQTNNPTAKHATEQSFLVLKDQDLNLLVKPSKPVVYNQWGYEYGYKLPEVQNENKEPAPAKPVPMLRTTSTGQDQLNFIKYMLNHTPLAPVMTPTHAVYDQKSENENPFESIRHNLRDALQENENCGVTN